jgi:hypothetical protein
VKSQHLDAHPLNEGKMNSSNKIKHISKSKKPCYAFFDLENLKRKTIPNANE